MAVVGIHFNKSVWYLPDPVYLWEDKAKDDEKMTFTQNCSWDKEGTVWSVGKSKKCFHILLTPYGSNAISESSDVNIGWLSFINTSTKKIVDYAARMVTHTEYVDQTRPTPYINFIAHEGKVDVTFTPSDPLLKSSLSSKYTVDFQDFLNYFYYSLANIDPSEIFYYGSYREKVFVSKLQLNNKKALGKTFQYKGYWLLWHRSRLENDPSWNPPSGQNFTSVAADTVLCGMPSRGKKSASECVGNINKGKGMAEKYEGSFSPREPIPIPMFLGPGTVTISPHLGKVVIYSKNKENQESTKDLPYLIGDNTNATQTKREIVSINVKQEPYRATVHSILEKFRNVDTWKPKDWDQQGGLICECAYEEGKYYDGQTPGDTEVLYKIDEIVIRNDWKRESPEIKCAIVFVMFYASNNKGFTYDDIVKRFTGDEVNLDFVTKPLYSDGLTTNTLTDYKTLGAFEFGKNYAYIIDPASTVKIPSREIEVHMPGERNTYEFAALIYRIVAKDSDNYRIDPDYNFPIEYWIGIRSVNSDGSQYRINRGNQQTQPPSTSQNNDGGSINKATDQSGNSSFGIQKPSTSLRIVSEVPSTIRPPPQGSYIKCYLLDLTRHEKIWSDARISLPYKAGDTNQSDIVFLMSDIPQMNEYALYIQQYDHFHRPVGRPRQVGPVHSAVHIYDIQSLKIVVDESQHDDLRVTLSELKMPNVPSDAIFTYMFNMWVDDHLVGSTQLGVCKPSEFGFTVNYPHGYSLPKSAMCDIMLTVYEDTERTKQVAFYHYPYMTEHFIKSFTVTDIYRGTDKYSDDEQKARVQFTFEAHTTLPAGDKRYRCRIELNKFTDDVEEETPAIASWDFEEIHGDFKATADSPIEIDRSQYVIFIQLIENGTNIGREKFYVFWEAPGRMASGTIICGDRAVTLSSPATRPSEARIEYRIMRDGVLGVVESPWEMRTESMIGGVAVTHPAWMVRPRIVSFRLLVTAPVDHMSDALHTLLEVLTAAPKKGLTINLQSSNELYLLSLDGYIQVGSPKIEEREDRWVIVSVVLECPNYAWKGYPLVKQLSGMHEVKLPVLGHYPPSVSIWIQPQKSQDIQLSINDQKPLLMTADANAPMYIQVHHDPITQKYSVTGHQSYPNANDGGDVTLRNYAPHSIRSIVLGDNTNRPYDTDNMLKLVEPNSYLPVILVPQIENRIKVEGGQIRAIEYTPYYAFWW